MFLIGKEAIWIQNFGWWNGIGSVLIYVKPNNPDIRQVFGAMVEYQELRTQEGQALDRHEKSLAKLQLQVATQSNKIKRARKVNKKLTTMAMMSGRQNKRRIFNTHYQQNKDKKHVYTEYGQHSYKFVDGKWEFNPYAKARNVPVQFSALPIPVGLPGLELVPRRGRRQGTLVNANRVVG